jgi:ubiquinone/menaquinone biosynthesis C-methylase UbiE
MQTSENSNEIKVNNVDSFQGQAAVYDLFYASKQYDKESTKINELIRSRLPNAQSLLSIGCGTARYECEFLKLGFKEIVGVDKSSEMLKIANERINSHTYNNKITLINCDGDQVKLNKKFDVVTILFCVVNYFLDNNSFCNLLKNCSLHLNKNGLLIFDSWYTPGVLHSPPKVRYNEYKFKDYTITRKVTPYPENIPGIYTLNYLFEGIPSEFHSNSTFTEKHRVRSYSKNDIGQACNQAGFSRPDAFDWPSGDILQETSWSGLWITNKL